MQSSITNTTETSALSSQEEEVMKNLTKAMDELNKEEATAKISRSSWQYEKTHSKFVIEMEREIPGLGMKDSFSFTVNNDTRLPRFHGGDIKVIYHDETHMTGFKTFRGMINQGRIIIQIEPSVFIDGQVTFEEGEQPKARVTMAGSGSWLGA